MTARNRNIWRMKRFWLGLFTLTALICLSSCSAMSGVRILMKTASDTPRGAAPTPNLSALSLEDWNAQRPSFKGLFQTEIYGSFPHDIDATHIEGEQILNSQTYKAHITQTTIVHNDIRFNAVIASPQTQGPHPVIMLEGFCPRHAVIPVDGVTRPEGEEGGCGDNPTVTKIAESLMGKYIITPPIQMIMDQGYALAVIYPPETYPDKSDETQFYKDSSPNPEHEWGAIAAWAYQFSILAHQLDEDPRFAQIIAYGHSRYGKAALLAAAFDPRIDGVIAHQSGTGGASLSRDKPGETVKNVNEEYPHWFTSRFSDYNEDQSTLPVDQHQLLALIAPRPILLGNARRDIWSDPEGAFRSAQGASPIYKLYDKSGLTAQNLGHFKPEDDIAFWIRPGTHGVVTEDWPAFLAFLDAHFK